MVGRNGAVGRTSDRESRSRFLIRAATVREQSSRPANWLLALWSADRSLTVAALTGTALTGAALTGMALAGLAFRNSIRGSG